MVGSGQRGLRVCLHVRQVLAQRAQVFEPCGGRGLLMAGCKCPAGLRDGVGTPRATEGTGPLESSMGNPPPMPPVPKSVLSTLCGAEHAARQCGLWDIARSSEWQGGLLFPRTGAQGPCKTAVTSQGGSCDPSRVGHVTFKGWVTRPLKGGSRDPTRVGHVTPKGWLTRPLRVGHVTPQG